MANDGFHFHLLSIFVIIAAGAAAMQRGRVSPCDQRRSRPHPWQTDFSFRGLFILVVDDDPAVRHLTWMISGTTAYRPFSAITGPPQQQTPQQILTTPTPRPKASNHKTPTTTTNQPQTPTTTHPTTKKTKPNTNQSPQHTNPTNYNQHHKPNHPHTHQQTLTPNTPQKKYTNTTPPQNTKQPLTVKTTLTPTKNTINKPHPIPQQPQS